MFIEKICKTNAIEKSFSLQFLSWSRRFAAFMEPELSSCSQNSTTVDDSLMGYCSLQNRRIWQTFQKCLLPPSSERSISLMMHTVSTSFLCSGFLPIVLILGLQSGQMLFQATTLN